MSLQEQFEQAAIEVKQLPAKPSNTDLLALYALYKQGTEGDVTGERPGGMDFKGAAKFDAWTKQKGKSKEQSMQEYIDLVKRLQAG